jgi:nucleotide-binding universal stress UspA family protein
MQAADPKLRELRLETKMVEGHPAETICRVAKEEGCDLIVMGTHGRSGLGRLLLGSVAEQVLREAACPVLTVKMPAESPAKAKPEKALANA